MNQIRLIVAGDINSPKTNSCATLNIFIQLTVTCISTTNTERTAPFTLQKWSRERTICYVIRTLPILLQVTGWRKRYWWGKTEILSHEQRNRMLAWCLNEAVQHYTESSWMGIPHRTYITVCCRVSQAHNYISNDHTLHTTLCWLNNTVRRLGWIVVCVRSI
jgi:hypothetical protein